MSLAALTVLAAKASACAVCFSGKAAGIAGLLTGLTWSILFLLTVTGSLIGGIVAVVMKVEREKTAREGAGA